MTKIDVIKAVRARFSIGLKESKEFVDSLTIQWPEYAPAPAVEVSEEVHKTLRDEFAMVALNGLLASGMAYDDKTICASFAAADRCMVVRKS